MEKTLNMAIKNGITSLNLLNNAAMLGYIKIAHQTKSLWNNAWDEG